MTVEEVRSKYLAFFKAKDHVVIPSAPIIPGNDPTTLFTSSGMQPLMPYLLGKDHPEGKRLVNSQLSFRAGDIEEVGDNRHTTFFEMLGNWSLGDYFKKEQLPFIFSFLVDELKLDPSKLYVTIFSGDPSTGVGEDTEAIELWQNLFKEKGIDAAYVAIGSEAAGYEKGMQGARIFGYDEKNWWSRAGAPSKMPAGEPGGPDSEVFYDFGLPHNDAYGKECHPNCDCGRFIEIANSVFMQFLKQQDGSFVELPKRNVDFGGGLERMVAATLNDPDVFKIDVFREAKETLERVSGKTYEGEIRSFRIILDHIRAATFMLAEGITPSNTEAGYVLRRLLRRSLLELKKLGVEKSVLGEVSESYITVYGSQYGHLAAAKEAILKEILQEEERFTKTLSQGLKEFEKFKAKGLGADEVFLLFTTYGFPVELTLELAKEQGISVPQEEVAKKLKEHQELSRKGAEQKFAGGLADHSEQTVKYHTTHHILLKALQMVLGKEVHQRGSNITSERLRIDFSHGAKMTDEEKKKVEEIVNEVIESKLPVIRTVMKREEAESLGAEMEFGVKYPDTVSVYSVGPKDATEENPKIPEAFSLEFCGGPHVTNTGDIGEGGKRFRIKKEEAVAAGVRRIKGVVE